MARSLMLGLAVAGCGRTSPFLDYDEFDIFPAIKDPITEGCGKVDYLFVIDNSASMADYQRRLVQNFSTFIEGVQRSQDTLDSVHVGVVTTDNYAGNPAPCDQLGDLVVGTEGYNSSESQCGPYTEGHPYMTESDDLAASFACAAQVGTQGSDQERPLAAVGYALNADKLREGGCNAGFIRDDALLVIAVITDEDEPEVVDFAYERAVEAKNGLSDNVVAVALVVTPDGPCLPHGHPRVGHGIAQFARSFEHSFVGPICDDDYGPTFAAAVAVVQSACG
ncbi:MAG: hypothetical protein JKY37_20010 [Nannocystaceae bacterium]|nr:hypothetical protein [Nannocystaceae bacterium]